MRATRFAAALIAFGSTLFLASLSAGALPAPRDAGLSAASNVTEVRHRRGHRRNYRAPQRVMGLVPGPDRRRGRIIRLPR